MAYADTVEFDPTRDYPLGDRRPDLVTTPSGLHQADVTLEALRAGTLGGEDVRATAETIERQAAVALAAGRRPLAENLLRAAELAMLLDGVDWQHARRSKRYQRPATARA